MNRLLAALRQGSPPYILTLFLAALTWYITHIVDRARESPLVEASMFVRKTAVPNAEHQAILDIENLSEQLFKEVKFQILFTDSSSSVTKLESSIAFAPAVSLSDEPGLANRGMSFVLPWLQPHNRLRFVFNYRGKGTPELVLTESSTPMMVVKPSFITFFVRHEAKVLLGIILAFAVAATALIASAPPERDCDT